MEKPLGESGLYCEGGTESVHSLPSSSLLYHTNLVLQVCLNMNFKLPLCAEACSIYATLPHEMPHHHVSCSYHPPLDTFGKGFEERIHHLFLHISGCHWTVVMRSFFTLSVASTMPSLLLAVTRRPSASFLMASQWREFT